MIIDEIKNSNQAKSVIALALLDMQNLVDNGELNPLDMKILLDDVRKTIDELDEKYRASVFAEAEKYNKQHYGDYYVEVKTGGGRYQYDHIPAIVQINDELKRLQKIAQDSYKMSAKNLEMISQDGEVILPARYVSSKDYVVLKRKGG